MSRWRSQSIDIRTGTDSAVPVRDFGLFWRTGTGPSMNTRYMQIQNPGIPPFPDGDHRTIGRQVNEILSRLPKKRQNDEPGQRNLSRLSQKRQNDEPGQRNLSRLSQKRRNDEPGQQNPSRSTRGSHGITQVNSSAKHWPSQHHYRCPAQASSSRRAAKRGQSVFIAVRSLRLGTSSIGTQQISMLSSSFALGSTVWPGFSKANTVV